MTVKRMDNVGIVVEDIDDAIEFFTELGLELEGRAPIEGDWADGVTGLRDMRVEVGMRSQAVMRHFTVGQQRNPHVNDIVCEIAAIRKPRGARVIISQEVR